MIVTWSRLTNAQIIKLPTRKLRETGYLNTWIIFKIPDYTGYVPCVIKRTLVVLQAIWPAAKCRSASAMSWCAGNSSVLAGITQAIHRIYLLPCLLGCSPSFNLLLGKSVWQWSNKDRQVNMGHSKEKRAGGLNNVVQICNISSSSQSWFL